MAEWLAKNVLGAIRDGDVWRFMLPHFDHQEYRKLNKSRLIENIYSPAGFFVVWDAVERKGYYIKLIPPPPHYEFYLCHLHEVNKRPFTTDSLIKEGYGKDRYEAFYSAVYEATNEKINTNS